VLSKRLRILHVFRAPVGGLFRHVIDLARGQAEGGHEVGILCDASTGGERAEQALQEIRPHLTLGLTRIKMKRTIHPLDVTAFLAANRISRAGALDVLHGHGAKGGAYARLIFSSRPRGETIRVYTPHGGSFHYPPGSLAHAVYMPIEKMLARRTDLFLFESDYIAGKFRQFVGETDRLVRVVYNGLHPSEFEPVLREPEPFDLLCIGELRLEKGVHTLLDALALLRRERQRRLTLLIVGAGPYEQELHRRAKNGGIWDSVAFVPPQPIRSALARARLMVMPSHAESLPYVILEAAAAAQPLVATRVGGIPEIFGPDGDALVPPGDVGSLADAIQKKLAEPEAERAEQARDLADFVRGRFSTERMVSGVLSGYEAALQACAARVG
jgi:glycosyltransferase involved in cell wall biosynthesis